VSIRPNLYPLRCLLSILKPEHLKVDSIKHTANTFRMPGKATIRTSDPPRLASKSSTKSLSSRRATTTVVIPEEGPSTSLRAQICTIFGDAQRSIAGHRKLVVGFRKIQEACVYEPSKPGKHARQEFQEDDFNVEFARCVIRLMGAKKSEGVGDRLIRFIGFFLRNASEKGEMVRPRHFYWMRC